MLNPEYNNAHKIKNEQLGYSVPENYFVDLEQKINNKLPNNSQAKATQLISIFSLKQNKLLWSAAAAIILLFGFFWFTNISNPVLDHDLADLNYLFEEDLDTEVETEFTLLDMYLEEEELSTSDVDLQKIWSENNFDD